MERTLVAPRSKKVSLLTLLIISCFIGPGVPCAVDLASAIRRQLMQVRLTLIKSRMQSARDNLNIFKNNAEPAARERAQVEYLELTREYVRVYRILHPHEEWHSF